MRDVSPGIDASLQGPWTRPHFLASLDFGAPLFLSTRGDTTIEGTLYVGGRCDVVSADDWETCTLRLLNQDGALTTTALDGAWMGSSITIWHAAHLVGGYMDPDYVEEQDDYVDPDSRELLAVFVGVLDGAQSVWPWVTVQCVRSGVAGRYVPHIRLDAPLANHCTPPGTIIQWDGEFFRVDSEDN